jgi:hypothetical protein
VHGERFRAAVQNRYVLWLARYIHRLTDEYTITCIHRLTDKCTGLCSLVEAICLGSYTEGYITIIFLSTEEYKITEACTLFSSSECSETYINK